MAQKKYSIGVQDFKKLIEDNYCYVDKSDLMYKLVHSGSNAFLGRPRRFGKSLLCSMLRYYFEGRKELFEGLRIMELEKEWVARPVFHFKLSTGEYTSLKGLESTLSGNLSDYEQIYGKGTDEDTLSRRFAGIIRRAHERTGRKVAVLIDEYDKPLLETLDDKQLNEATRKVLKSFYGTMKGADEDIQFIFLTGVTKFAKVSVFSDLNNVKDISMTNDYAAICGITAGEIMENFEEGIVALAAGEDMSRDEVLRELKRKYDGYHFSDALVDVYNPFSLLSAFDMRRLNDFWFATGTPTYLTKLVKDGCYDLGDLQNVDATPERLGDMSEPEKDVVPILYQSGYLTIKAYDERFRLYKLDFPNSEVRNGFLNMLLPLYVPQQRTDSTFVISKFVRDVEAGRVDEFMERMQSLIASIPYTQIPEEGRVKLLEQQYQNVVYIIFTLMAYYTEVEKHCARGRMDMVVKTATQILIFEFKIGEGRAADALKQIDQKGYADQYVSDGREIVKIGVGFSEAARGIDEWMVTKQC